jgi:hypothetical protein
LTQGVAAQGIENFFGNLRVRALGDRFVRTEPVMRGGEREDREGLEEGEGRVWLVGGARRVFAFERRGRGDHAEAAEGKSEEKEGWHPAVH